MSLISGVRSSLRGSLAICNVRMYAGDKGSGGGAGAIREAGGSFGKIEAAREADFFYKKQKEQLKNIKEHLDSEIQHHQAAIKKHQEAIKRHQDHIEEMKEHK